MTFRSREDKGKRATRLTESKSIPVPSYHLPSSFHLLVQSRTRMSGVLLGPGNPPSCSVPASWSPLSRDDRCLPCSTPELVGGERAPWITHPQSSECSAAQSARRRGDVNNILEFMSISSAEKSQTIFAIPHLPHLYPSRAFTSTLGLFILSPAGLARRVDGPLHN